MHSLSIVIPAYNEEQRLPPTLAAVASFLDALQPAFAEVLVVDDGSRDNTAALVRQFAACHPWFKLLENGGNRGKGYAVRHGMLAAAGDWVLFTDADLSSPMEELQKLWCAARGQNAAVAIGSRALDRSLIVVRQPWLRETAGKFFNVIMRLVTGLPFHDTQCGFKLFRRDAAQAIFARQTLERFGFDVEALFIARALGIGCVEVPVRWADVAGTKVSTLGGMQGFLDLLVVRWNALRGRYR